MVDENEPTGLQVAANLMGSDSSMVDENEAGYPIDETLKEVQIPLWSMKTRWVKSTALTNARFRFLYGR